MKRYSSRSFVFLVIIALFAAACTGTTTPQVSEKPVDAPTAIPPSPTPVPPENTPTTPPPTATVAASSEEAAAEATPMPSPSPTEPPAPAATAVDWLTVQGRTTDGLPTLGNPDAPVRVIDYSDFL